jgi:hypothetical protein
MVTTTGTIIPQPSNQCIIELEPYMGSRDGIRISLNLLCFRLGPKVQGLVVHTRPTSVGKMWFLSIGRVNLMDPLVSRWCFRHDGPWWASLNALLPLG